VTTLLSVDGPAYRLLAGWFALVRASLVWLVSCLPVVTAPAATVVLVRSVARLLAGEQPPGLVEGWRQVRRDLAPAARLAGLLTAGWVLSLGALLGPSPGGMWDTVLPALVVPAVATWVLTCQWCFPILAHHGEGAVATLRRSYLAAIRRPGLAALNAAGTAALVGLGLLLPSVVWLPFWLTAPALLAAVTVVTSERATVRTREGRPR
jgi:hypothetical protein